MTISDQRERPVARANIRLLPPFVSADTIAELELLLQGARAGKVLGIAYAISLDRREFYVNTAGEFDRDLVYARGAVASLNDELGLRVNSAADEA